MGKYSNLIVVLQLHALIALSGPSSNSYYVVYTPIGAGGIHALDTIRIPRFQCITRASKMTLTVMTVPDSNFKTVGKTAVIRSRWHLVGAPGQLLPTAGCSSVVTLWCPRRGDALGYLRYLQLDSMCSSSPTNS